jgi:hypothetical protein
MIERKQPELPRFSVADYLTFWQLVAKAVLKGFTRMKPSGFF